MRITSWRAFVGLVVLVCAAVSSTQATHIRAGEITVERISCQSLNFRITVTGWVDLESTVEFGGGELLFGDGSPGVVLRESAILTMEQNLGNNVGVVQFQIEHTYGANGVYTLSYLEANRNAGILNMNNSVETTFYIETQIIIDPFLGCNNTPTLLIPPIDEGCIGAIFFHNPGAFDADGDSVSYEVTIPKRSRDTDVSNYRFPNDPSFGGTKEDGSLPTTFGIDDKTGDILWDSPPLEGEYNIAFVIREWRKIEGEVFQMSWITRDMQIIIKECDNERPELEIPDDVCVEAGTFIDETIIGRDPDDDPVKLEAFGGPFEVTDSPSRFFPDPAVFQAQPAQGTFQWQTNCFHVREQPYQVTFKITDDPEDGPNLVGFEPWNVTVVAPAPTGLDLQVNAERTIDLNWDSYVCSNAEVIQIWRRVDSFDIPFEECMTGIPDSAGYELIDEVSPTTNAYQDDNDGDFLDFGAQYCYRILAVFPSPAGGQSYVSTEVCGIIVADAPVITNVSVQETDDAQGEIEIAWRRPFDIDPVLFPPPYQYDVYRGEGLSPSTFDLIASNLQELDTVYTDTTSLDTENIAYAYQVMLKDINGTEIRPSSTASSVFLSPKSLFQKIELRWEADVPWSNNTQDYPMHYIYRDHSNTSDDNLLTLIDSVNVNTNGFVYLDEGQFNMVPLDERIEYCYYVITQGAYGNPRIAEPLINFSQIVCAQPNDTIPPCAPIVEVKVTDCDTFFSDKSCSFRSFQNELAWRRENSAECGEETVKYYNVYYSSTGEAPFELLTPGGVEDTVYVHDNLNSLAGCYYITSVDRSDNESEPSNLVCNENCPSYVLPNIFTPNGDGYNDVFNAFNDIDNPDLDPSQCPRFVNKVTFTVINRYGKVVYNFESGGENSILIGWDGRDNSGDQLGSGIYYYTAEVEFEAIDPELRNQVLRSWVTILR